MKQMSLGALRSIKPDQDIVEPNEMALPGTTSADSGSEDAGSLGGGGELPSLPPTQPTAAIPAAPTPETKAPEKT
jgi:hypothetical protein